MSMEFSVFQNAVINDGQNKGVFARFYEKPVKTGEILKNGLPKFEKKLFVEIRVRDQQDIFDQPATNDHIKRFNLAYQKYLIQKKQMAEGTPISMFAFLSLDQIECCELRGIYTIEALANLDDDSVKKLGLADESDLAKRFLYMAKNNALIYKKTQQEKEYQLEIKALKDEIERLKNQITQ